MKVGIKQSTGLSPFSPNGFAVFQNGIQDIIGETANAANIRKTGAFFLYILHEHDCCVLRNIQPSLDLDSLQDTGRHKTSPVLQVLCCGLVHRIAQETSKRREPVKNSDICVHFFYHFAFGSKGEGYFAALDFFRFDCNSITACP